MDEADPDPAGNMVLPVVLTLALILVNAFFAMSEIAIISLNDNKIRKMADGGHKAALKVVKLTEDSSGFLSTIQIGVTLAGFLTASSAAQSFSTLLAGQIAKWFSLEPTSAVMSFVNGASVVIITLITSYFSLVLGELAPKRIAIQKSESISFRVVGILLAIQKLMRPFIAILSVSTNLVVRAFGVQPHENSEVVTEEEIRMLVDVGEERGVIEESQKTMINNIFEFDDITAADVMTHRTDIAAVEAEELVDEIVRLSIESGRSRLPVYEEDLDNIIGIVYIRDLLPYVGKAANGHTARDIMRKAHFVPESKSCGKLFSEMTEKHIQMVMVVDEYGGIAGLVTMEDLLEAIVGNMQDEYDNETEEIEQISENTFEIEGITDIEEVEEILNIHLPEGEYDTLAGMIMAQLGRIPDEGEQPFVEVQGYRFTVVSLDERRIERVLVERIDPLPEENAADSKTNR